MADFEQKVGDAQRMEQMLELLSRMAAGEVELRIPVTGAFGHLDALAHGINILAQELSYCMSVLKEEKEEATKASEAKSAFVAEVSHDIRTPLMAISSFAEFLGKENLSSEKRMDYLQRLNANCRSLHALVNEVLDLSKVESGRLSLAPTETSIREKITEVVSTLEPLAKEKGLCIELSISDGVPATAVIDSVRLWQVVNNLLGNAIKFSQQGVIKVHVSLEKGCLSVEVVDRGIGVPAEAQSKIFHSFEQADGSIARRFGGSGLGLTLSRKLCRAMGGDLTLVSSELGKGSHFKATLALGPAARISTFPGECNVKAESLETLPPRTPR